MLRARIAWSAALVLTAFPAAAPAQMTWNFTFESGSGFNATSQATLQTAASYIGSLIDSRATVHIDVQPSGSTGGELASAGPFFGLSTSYRRAVPNTFLQATQNNQTGNQGTLQVDFSQNWNLGTGTPGGGQFDLQSVLTHELTHAIGFTSLLDTDPSVTTLQSAFETVDFGGGDIRHYPDFFTRYDAFLQRNNGGTLTNFLQPGGSLNATLADATSDQVNWTGQYATAANGGTQVRIYAPNPWEPGSSMAHVRDNTFPNAVMAHAIGAGETRRAYQGFEIGMLLDIGFNNFEWKNTTGNWSAGATSLATSQWANSAIHTADTSVLAPLGSVTNNMVLTFGGSGSTGYVATNDLPANPFMFNRLILNSTSTATNTLQGNALQMSFDNGYTVTPRIDQQNTGAFAINNAVAIPNGLDVSGAGTGAVTLGGVVSGGGGVTKSGAFTLFLNGTNTYAGVTAVSGGTLGGTGQTGAGLTVTGTGRVAPGAAPGLAGTLTVNGNVSFAAGTHFAVDVNGTAAGQYDRLLVTGAGRAVSLGNATLDVTLATGFTPTHYFILDLADGGSTISGQFNGLGEGASLVVGGQTFFISYHGDAEADSLFGGNDVVLSLTPVPEPGSVLAVVAPAVGLVGVVRRWRRRAG